MYYFRPETISFENLERMSLWMNTVYNLNVLVNGRPIMWSRFEVHHEQQGIHSDFTFINDKENDETTLHFHGPLYVAEQVDTVDIIIRDSEGKAIEAFLNVDFTGGKCARR